jgi:hypothetical protein
MGSLKKGEKKESCGGRVLREFVQKWRGLHRISSTRMHVATQELSLVS